MKKKEHENDENISLQRNLTFYTKILYCKPLIFFTIAYVDE